MTALVDGGHWTARTERLHSVLGAHRTGFPGASYSTEAKDLPHPPTWAVARASASRAALVSRNSSDPGRTE